MKTFILILNIFLLVACQNQPVQREEMVSQHPEWDQEAITLVRNGYLKIGMTQDQVKAAWGSPHITGTGTAKGDWGESWEYATQVVFFDKTGKVTRWVSK